MAKIIQHRYPNGGRTAHLLRRLLHLSVLPFLWIYYQYIVTVPQLIWAFLPIIVLLEMLRLWKGWVVFGQRDYERKQISAFTWGAVSMSLVLFFAPDKAFAIPIIAAYAIGDPLLGELRQTALSKIFVILIGIFVIAGVWALSSFWFGTPLWLALPMGVITVAAEWPCLKYIDDNAVMQLIPLLIILIISSLK